MGFTGTGDLDRFGSTTIAAVFGGMASQATGGDFYEGAMRAAFVHLFNELGNFEFMKSSNESDDRILEMQFKYSKRNFQKYQAKKRAYKHALFLEKTFPHLTKNPYRSYTKASYYNAGMTYRKTGKGWAKEVRTGPSTGDVVGLGLSVGAALTTGGVSTIMGLTAIGIDMNQGDGTGMLIGALAMRFQSLSVFDIGYGIDQVAN